MAKKFSISNTTLKSLANLNVSSLLITSKCVAGFLSTHSDHLFKADGSLLEQVINLMTRYKSNRIYNISAVVEGSTTTPYVLDILACYPNGKVAHMNGDLLSALPERSIRHQFKNAEEILNYKETKLSIDLPKIEKLMA